MTIFIGKHIYQCDFCNHIWVTEKELKRDSPCPICELKNALDRCGLLAANIRDSGITKHCQGIIDIVTETLKNKPSPEGNI